MKFLNNVTDCASSTIAALTLSFLILTTSCAYMQKEEPILKELADDAIDEIENEAKIEAK